MISQRVVGNDADATGTGVVLRSAAPRKELWRSGGLVIIQPVAEVNQVP